MLRRSPSPLEATPEEVGAEGEEGEDLGAVALLLVVVAGLVEVVMSMAAALAQGVPTLYILTVLLHPCSSRRMELTQ